MIQNYKGRKAMQQARSLLLFEIRRRELYVQDHYREGYRSEKVYTKRAISGYS